MNGNLNVQTENIFPVIKKFLYSDHEIFLRELVSNAIDATQKLKALASRGELKGETGDLTVEIAIDNKKKTLTVSDRGIGMTAEEVEKYINQIAFSGATDFLDKYKDVQENLIGHFGLGFYSAFMVADKVEIFSKSYKGPFWAGILFRLHGGRQGGDILQVVQGRTRHTLELRGQPGVHHGRGQEAHGARH